MEAMGVCVKSPVQKPGDRAVSCHLSLSLSVFLNNSNTLSVMIVQ